MNRASLAERIWVTVIVPVFLERFLLVVCAAAFYGIVILNSMQIDGHYRAGVGLILVGLAYVLGHTVYRTNQAAKVPENRATDAARAGPLPTPTIPKQTAVDSPVTTLATMPGISFLSEDITPPFLMSLYKINTEIQAEKLVASYLGQWMTVSGEVVDVAKSGDSDHRPMVQAGPGGAYLFKFSPVWEGRVSGIRRASHITVTGRLEQVHSLFITLNDCEIERL